MRTSKVKIIQISLILIFLISYLIFPATISTTVKRIFYPIFFVGGGITKQIGFVYKTVFADVIELDNQNKQLRNELTKLRANIATEKFNSSGKGEITLRVIGRPPQTRYDFLLLDAKKIAGIKRGDLVYDRNTDQLIGTLGTITKDKAAVILFSHQSNETLISDGFSIETAVGKGGGGITTRVQKNAQINPGDFLYAQEFGGVAFARVQKVDNNPEESHLEIFAELLVSPFSITHVNIISN